MIREFVRSGRILSNPRVFLKSITPSEEDPPAPPLASAIG
jgi:hypothetical protein